jgi:hypothetical protein
MYVASNRATYWILTSQFAHPVNSYWTLILYTLVRKCTNGWTLLAVDSEYLRPLSMHNFPCPGHHRHTLHTTLPHSPLSYTTSAQERVKILERQIRYTEPMAPAQILPVFADRRAVTAVRLINAA